MKKDTKIGFIITYFHASEEGLKLLKETIRTISKENYYVVLASHSPVDEAIQEIVDFYFFQRKNIVDDRKYSHGVAESNLIEISLKHLKDQGIEWTYKSSYDIEIIDINEFKRWDKREFSFVSCNWGNNFICTNSFFTNVNFLLKNVRFYKTIDEMFSVNTVLENCWEFDFVTKELQSQIYSFKDKSEFFGKNKIDVLYYDYNLIDFWYSENEKKFFVCNRSTQIDRAHIRIFDYETDLCIYLDRNFNLAKDIVFWIIPPFSNNLSFSKNGFYLEVYLENITIRKNILIKDFDEKHKLSNKFGLIKNTEVKFNEFSDFNNLKIYQKFGINLESINNFVDIGANYGMASVSFIENEIKSYLVEADPKNVEILDRIWSNNSKIKIIDKAVSDKDGSIDFYISPGIHSVVSSLFETDVNGNSVRQKVSVKSITPNTLIEDYIEEETIDLLKIDIEGSEYDFFRTISDENLCKVKRFLIEFHNNDNYRVMEIITKLASNGYRYKFSKWSDGCGDFIPENKMGVIYAERH